MTDTSSASTTGVILPSSRTLARSTAIAAAVAALLLVTVVMPAEYGVDPTGVGGMLSLTKMGQIKRQLAREAAADAAGTPSAAQAANSPAAPEAATAGPVPPAAVASTVPAPAPATASAAGRTDEITLTLAPSEGKEVKLAMRQGARVQFRWSTNQGVVNYDTHADRTAPPAIKYHGYAKGQAVPADSGQLVAAFDGMHGWFWRNRGRSALVVTLRTTGDYSEIREMK